MPQRVTFWWTDEQERVIKMRAAETGLTVSQIMRIILDKECQTGGTIVEQGWRAGFSQGCQLAMLAVRTALHDVEHRMAAGEFQVPPVDLEEPVPVEMMNGAG